MHHKITLVFPTTLVYSHGFLTIKPFFQECQNSTGFLPGRCGGAQQRYYTFAYFHLPSTEMVPSKTEYQVTSNLLYYNNQQQLQGDVGSCVRTLAVLLLLPFHVTRILDLCRNIKDFSPEGETRLSMKGAVKKDNSKSSQQTNDHACKSDLL